MAAKHCPKHDITVPEGGTCWNCEESAMSAEERELAYQDPAFLAKRGGEGKHQLVLSGLTVAQMKRLREMLGEDTAAASSSGNRARISL
jgi:hypothetical protein